LEFGLITLKKFKVNDFGVMIERRGSFIPGFIHMGNKEIESSSTIEFGNYS
jgi:hypothetical protein